MNEFPIPDPTPDERDADVARRRLGLQASGAANRVRPTAAPGLLARRRRMLRYGKFVLPAVALLLLGAIAVWPEVNRQLTLGTETAREVAAVRRDSGRMIAPHYSGIDSHDHPYTITATFGRQVGPSRIDLEAPVLDIATSTGWVLIHAERGTYMQDANFLSLTGNVTLYRDDGIIANSPATDIDVRSSVIASQDWIHADGPFGVLDAQGYMLAQSAGIAQFSGPARLVLNDDHVASGPNTGGTIAARRNPTQTSTGPATHHAHGQTHRRSGPHHK